jgi:hypothetical protein
MLYITHAPFVNSLVDHLFSVEVDVVDVNIPSANDMKVGAVRAGTGGLFGDEKLLSSQLDIPNRTDASNYQSIFNPIRKILLGFLDGSEAKNSAIIHLVLGLLYSIIKCPIVSSETLKSCNLYPRRQMKSKRLMVSVGIHLPLFYHLIKIQDSLTTAPIMDQSQQYESFPAISLTSTASSISTNTLSLPYDETLVKSLIGLISPSAITFQLPSVSSELAAKVLIEIAATGGLKNEKLVPSHMELLVKTEELHRSALVQVIEDFYDVSLDIFKSEAYISSGCTIYLKFI